jgi:hypothetical protein
VARLQKQRPKNTNTKTNGTIEEPLSFIQHRNPDGLPQNFLSSSPHHFTDWPSDLLIAFQRMSSS